MCKTFEIAKNTADEFATTKTSFSLEQLAEEIVNRKGVQRVAPNFTVKRYLEYLEDKGIIVYDFSTMKYYNVDVLEEKRLKILNTTC